MNNNLSEESNVSILYELLEYFIRKQEPELIKCKNDTAILPSTGTIKNALRYLNNRYSLPEGISQQVSLTLPWKFAAGDHGRILGILQDNIIEIRKAKDEYSSIAGKATAPKDAFPQWRKLAWSPDGTILVLASSNGYTSFYNALGNNIFNISPKTISQNPNVLEAGDAIICMIFLKPRVKTEKWTYEFILISYSGLLRSYHISANSFSANYDFSFGNFYKNGINAVAYDEKRNLFYVAGNMITQKLTSTASESGLTSWRLLNDDPYCKLSFTFENSISSVSRFSMWNVIPLLRFQPESIIFTMKISPNDGFLVCLHIDGSVSLWGLPNLILQKKWKLSEQPEYNIPNPLGLGKYKKFPTGFTEHQPIDVGWWSDQAIIIARYSGSVSVCSTWNLKNLLGASPEFLAGQPQIFELDSEKGFLCLDCETFITSKKRKREPNDTHLQELLSESEEDEDGSEPSTIFNYTTNLVQSTLYSITDIEKFQPKRKKSKVLHRTYRIMGLKSTTPEELYTRKINIEEYQEALSLANTYGLDTDLVYQRQWRKSELTLNAIAEHLGKVSKRSWVLNECVTRVPDTLEAARELLNFGLRGANLETLMAIHTCDNDKFVTPDMEDDWQVLNDNVNLGHVQKVNKMLEEVDIKNLSDAQKDLIKYRRKLLNHLDKLLTYEIILKSSANYKKEFYEEFRRLSAVENAIRFAKDSDCRAVEIMFTYYGENLLPHWLAIISCFPETLNPLDYEKLLPECDSEGHLFLLYQHELRQKDWVEKPEFDEIVNFDGDDKSEILYELNPSLSIYRNKELTLDLLQKWYKTRAYEIEKNSSIIDNALQLVKIATSHNINGMEDLLLDLETLDDLVYRLCLEDMSLNGLEKLSNIDKIKLLMSTSTKANFIENIRLFLVPFIKRRHQYLRGDLQKHLLSDYLICLSKDDLTLPVKLFTYLRQAHEVEVTKMIDDAVTLALDCVYACENTDDIYEKAKDILDSIPKDHDERRTNAICNLLEEFERELNCIEILSKYGIKTTLKFICKNKSNPEIAKSLLTQMARSLNKKLPPPDEREWAQLLNEILDIHELIFSCIVIETCFEICVSARLVSGVKSTIQNCATLIETKKKEQSLLKVSYENAIELILEATKEYFNGSKACTDLNIELAKVCLYLIEDDNIKIKKERDLIRALQILNEFDVEILPIQVRVTADRLTLIELCLNSQLNAYKNQQRLLTLATYLQIEGNNHKRREGRVLELIARKAFEFEDYDTCSTICMRLSQDEYVPAWKIFLDLGSCDNYQNLKVRMKCLWFAINNGPSSMLTNALKHVHLIQRQMLHKSLELLIPPVDFKDYKDEESNENEDEFMDAITTPQTEIKDFVPKLLGTSTGIVKSSANIVKKSTFGLIKNISDTKFWKSKLNFVGDSKSALQYENEQEQEVEDIDLQGFPCYYTSLHETCRISTTETRYDKYSMPDIQNTKLKYCHALLRATALDEPSYYGLEAKNINDLLCECAKHVIPDDWLLGMSYLLNLNGDNVQDIQRIFASLPQTELYIQSALYYFSLKLYKKLYINCENLYLCSPLDLVGKMIAAIQTAEECDIVKALQYWQDYLPNEKKLIKLGQTVDTLKQDNACAYHEETSTISSATDEKQKLTIPVNTSQPCNKDKDLKNVSMEDSNTDTIEWTEDWSNFSDDDTETVSDQKDKIKSKTHPAHIITDCLTEEERFKVFQKMFNEMNNLEQYQELKKIILQWPKFSMPDHITLDNNPILKMMIIISLVIKTETVDFENRILQEHGELIKLLVSTKILKQFLEVQRDHLSFEQRIYIRLCSEDADMYEEAVHLLKQQHAITLSPLLLEKLFLNNLTGRFINCDIYKQIIEHVFVNKSLTDIETNAKLLICELKEREYILEAMNIIRLTRSIPKGLCTFDTCSQLLMEE